MVSLDHIEFALPEKLQSSLQSYLLISLKFPPLSGGIFFIFRFLPSLLFLDPLI